MKKIKREINNTTIWIKKNFWKIAIIVAVHISISFMLELPYINLIRLIVAYVPYLIDWILVLILFKPQKDKILKSSFVLMIIGFFFYIIHMKSIVEIIGLAVYLFIATYILLSLKEIRYKNND